MLTASQQQAEVQRKAKAGIALTNPTAASTALYKQTQAALKPAASAVAPAVKPVQPADLVAKPGEGAVRKYFNDNGYQNVGFDKARNMVTVNGLDALSPGRISGGTAFASSDSLASALSKVRNTETGNKVNSQLSNIEAMLKEPGYTPGTFSYDPGSDQVYQAALARAKVNAQSAGGDAMAELNKRGILDSTITGDRVAQIGQDAVAQVDSQLLPQLSAAAYDRFRDAEQMKYQQSRDKVNDAGALLADYMGVDQAQRGNDQQAWENRFNYGNAVGKFGNGQQTQAAKQFDQTMAYQKSSDAENRAYQRVRDAIGDGQWQAQFDQNVKQQGLSFALQQLQETNQQAYQQAQLALAQDDNSRQWASLDAQLAAGSASKPPEYSGMSADQVLQQVKRQFSDEDGIMLPNSNKKDIYKQIIAYGLPDGQDDQVMLSLGLSKADIAAFDKEIGLGK
ncbi:hypothetical protein [Paenibacillus humicus]|uniref:hypothetical protein n=1 Tax=Paenibacillus humicus TaxID=412861 RepID=UPI003F135FA0